MSLRARLTSFVAGFGVAGGATFYQLHKDITAGTQYLSEQVCWGLRKSRGVASRFLRLFAAYNRIQEQLSILIKELPGPTLAHTACIDKSNCVHTHTPTQQGHGAASCAAASESCATLQLGPASSVIIATTTRLCCSNL